MGRWWPHKYWINTRAKDVKEIGETKVISREETQRKIWRTIMTKHILSQALMLASSARNNYIVAKRNYKSAQDAAKLAKLEMDKSLTKYNEILAEIHVLTKNLPLTEDTISSQEGALLSQESVGYCRHGKSVDYKCEQCAAEDFNP